MKDYFSTDCILLAWERYIRCNQKEAKDYLGIKAFGSNLEENINSIGITLTDELKNDIEDIHLSDPNPCV